jgi:hypothetical protein
MCWYSPLLAVIFITVLRLAQTLVPNKHQKLPSGGEGRQSSRKCPYPLSVVTAVLVLHGPGFEPHLITDNHPLHHRDPPHLRILKLSPPGTNDT